MCVFVGCIVLKSEMLFDFDLIGLYFLYSKTFRPSFIVLHQCLIVERLILVQTMTKYQTYIFSFRGKSALKSTFFQLRNWKRRRKKYMIICEVENTLGFSLLFLALLTYFGESIFPFAFQCQLQVLVFLKTSHTTVLLKKL